MWWGINSWVDCSFTFCKVYICYSVLFSIYFINNFLHLVIVQVVALVCNFSGSCNSATGRLNHSEVETLFHEFGHALHSLLSRTVFYWAFKSTLILSLFFEPFFLAVTFTLQLLLQDYQHFSGTRVMFDLAETPSNLFEWVECYNLNANFPDYLYFIMDFSPCYFIIKFVNFNGFWLQIGCLSFWYWKVSTFIFCNFTMGWWKNISTAMKFCSVLLCFVVEWFDIQFSNVILLTLWCLNYVFVHIFQNKIQNNMHKLYWA